MAAEEDSAFLRSKSVYAGFYAAHVLPQTGSLYASIVAGADPITPVRSRADGTVIQESVMNELNGYDIEDLAVGMTATFSKTFTEADIVRFAGVLGDTNAIQINEEVAASTPFGGRIAHGMLTASVISAAIAGRLPGPGSIYLEQKMRFVAPVRPGDTVHANVTVMGIGANRRVTLETICRVGAKDVVVGEATVKVGSSQAREEKQNLKAMPAELVGVL